MEIQSKSDETIQPMAGLLYECSPYKFTCGDGAVRAKKRERKDKKRGRFRWESPSLFRVQRNGIGKEKLLTDIFDFRKKQKNACNGEGGGI